MILLDKPYVSEFLIKTIQDNGLEVIATPEAQALVSNTSLNWISESEARQKFEENSTIKVYSNSENSIAWIESNFKNSELPKKIELFKNKVAFRTLLKEAYPDYFFMEIQKEDLTKIREDVLKFPLILKPTVGFFSLAVHKVDNYAEWKEVVFQIEKEIQQFKGLYPEKVIDTATFIAEEFIEGEEYAVDAYFDQNGEPVLLDILHHVFSSDKDVSDRIYTTSVEIIKQHQHKVIEFLKLIGTKADLKNFPMHLEIRIDSDDKIIPIEVNPLRFGGWCTTADLAWFAYGFNPYLCFLKVEKPNWEALFTTKKNKLFSIIVLDNNSSISENDIASFDIKKLESEFEKPLHSRKVDFTTYPVFGFLFTETSVGNEKELQRILTSDLRDYIVLK
jgi:hypothetical protein